MNDEEPAGYLGGAAGPGTDEPEEMAYLGGQTADDPDPYGAPQEEEVAGYLGGAPAEEDPYGAPAQEEEVAGYLGGAPAAEDPYGAPAQEEEVAGYLGGAEEEVVGALPPREETRYSASDFVGQQAPVEDEPYDDGYGAPVTEEYEEQGYAEEGYEDQGYGEPVAEADPSYYDSMGHAEAEPAPASGLETQPLDDYQEDYGRADEPKTISQRDAEDIINRITTKRILPPEAETDGLKVPPPPKLTPTGGGLRLGPLVIVVLLVGAGLAGVFRKQLGKAVPALANLPVVGEFFKSEEEAPPLEIVQPKESEPDRLKREMQELLLLSERKAFGLQPNEVAPRLEKPQTPGGQPQAPSTPGAPSTPQAPAQPQGGN